MKLNSEESAWLTLDEVDSTQRVAADQLRRNSTVSIVFAHHQSAGRGRFDRSWVSQRGESLTVSFLFRAYHYHSHPWLVGMAVALAAARAVDCKVQWPNDLLLGGKKLGGILTEILPDSLGHRVPVVGLGINLGPSSVPLHLAESATSLYARDGYLTPPEKILNNVIREIQALPTPERWPDLAQTWMGRDATAGKQYKLASGEIATARGIGPDGQLVAELNEEELSVFAADAIFGGRVGAGVE